jgi:acetyl esterase/lipase
LAGDSAGGGIILALLQILRDTNLPLPAGGILVSPWCDLTHSFPSIHTNTTTDVIPEYGPRTRAVTSSTSRVSRVSPTRSGCR